MRIDHFVALSFVNKTAAREKQKFVKMTLSSTELKKLLDDYKYQEFQTVLENHYDDEKNHDDVASSQKVTNLILCCILFIFNRIPKETH